MFNIYKTTKGLYKSGNFVFSKLHKSISFHRKARRSRRTLSIDSLHSSLLARVYEDTVTVIASTKVNDFRLVKWQTTKRLKCLCSVYFLTLQLPMHNQEGGKHLLLQSLQWQENSSIAKPGCRKPHSRQSQDGHRCLDHCLHWRQ